VARGSLSFDASLFDSHFLSYTLAGDVAARFALLPRPNYVFSVGGFHPAYTPPPMDLPAMRRLSITLLGGDNPRLRAELYLARTSNSFQFGASVELYAKISKFNVYGFLGFDTLIQILPTKLAASVRATLAVRIDEDPILSVGAELELEGPRPWHAKGKAHFEICWFLSFTVHFDKTWGDDGEDHAPSIAVLPLLVEALSDASAWTTQTAPAVVQLRTTDATVVDPAGTLVVSQKRVPLDLTIEKFSSAIPQDATRFSITRVTSRGAQLYAIPVTDEFAPAEFLGLTDAEKLSRPSFEEYPSGVSIGEAASLVADHAVARNVEYETLVIDRTSPARPAPKRPLDVSRFDQLIRGGAIGRSPLAKNIDFTPAKAAVTTRPDHFVIVSIVDLQPVGSPHATHGDAREDLRRMTAADPSLAAKLQIITTGELAA
jgi:hypothetical protein